MATKETITDLIRSMASVWNFPGKDLKATAGAYHVALRDLSDDDVKGAITALLSEWTKNSPPKPADIRMTAATFKTISQALPGLPQREPSHEEIMLKVRRDTYACRAIAEVLGEHRRHEHPRFWTRPEWLAIAKRQKELRTELGLPEPPPKNAVLRTERRS